MSKFLDETGLSYFWSKIKANLKTVAFTGSYNDLIDTPTIPEGATVDTALNSSSTNPVQNKAINSALATKVTASQAVDAVSAAGYTTSSYVSTYVSGATVASAGTATNVALSNGTNIPAENSANYTKYLRGDGVWSDVNATNLGGLTSAGYVQTGNVNQTISGTKTFINNVIAPKFSATNEQGFYVSNGGEAYLYASTGFGGVYVNNNKTDSTAHKMSLQANTSGNAGIWDNTKSRWVLISDSAGNVTMSGNALTATSATNAGTAASCTGNAATATNASSLGGLTSAGYVQTGNVNQTISGTKTFATNTNMAAIEFTGASNHGGFLDFHYGQSTSDYTTRIIEQESGKLGVKGRMVISGAGTNPATQGLTITGTGNYALALQNTTIKKGTAPTAANNYIGIDFFGSASDNYNKRLGLIETNTTSANQNSLQIVAYHTNSATATGGASLKLCTSNGSAWAEIPEQLNCTNGTVSCCATSAAAQVYVDNGMGHKIGLHTNTSNQAGIYDWSKSKWLVRGNSDGTLWLNGCVTSAPSGTTFVAAAKTDGALVNATTTTFGAIFNAPTKNYRIALATWPGTDDNLQLYSVTNANVSAGTNTKAKALYWNASTGALTADSFNGTATSATYWGSEQNDISTNNTSATWVLVDQGGKCQHMLRANMVVGSATTAGSCTGNAATATTAASCTGNAATATNASSLGGKAASQYLTAHQSLANYVTLNGSQTITGAKTFSGQNITVSGGNIHTYNNGGFYAHNAADSVNGSLQANGSNVFGIYFNTKSKWVVHVTSAGVATFSGSLAGSSDERLKGAIATIDGKVLDAWDKVDWRQFKYNSEVAEKGENAPVHVGLVAQHVSNCLVENGVDADSLHIIGNDYLNTAEEDTPDEYVVYYVEALCMEAAYQRRRAERAEARITALEQQFNELEEVLTTLGDHSNAS